MADERIVRAVKEIIQKEFLDLNDIPYELANTIANIYYKSLVYATDKSINPMSKHLPYNKNGWSVVDCMTQSLYDIEVVQRELEFVPVLIKELREQKQRNHQFEYKMAVLMALDTLKYNIF